MAVAKFKNLLYKEHAKRVGVLDSLELVITPVASRGVVATKILAKDVCILVPVSMIVNISKQTERIPNSAVNLGVAFKHPKCQTPCCAYAMPKWHTADIASTLSGCSAKKQLEQFLSPFWLVGTTNDRNAANLALRSIKVSGSEDAISIPMYQNTKALKVGDILLAFHGDAENKRRKVA